jgi:basic membrane protein A
VYYTYAVKTLLEGGEIAQDWCKGLSDGAVSLTTLNAAIAAEGTQEAVDAALAELISGTKHVFAGPLSGKGVDFDGNEVSMEVAEGDYFREGETASAPAWNYIIDGITVLR